MADQPKRIRRPAGPSARWLPDFGGLLGNAQKALKRRKLAIDGAVDGAVNGPSQQSKDFRIQ